MTKQTPLFVKWGSYFNTQPTQNYVGLSSLLLGPLPSWHMKLNWPSKTPLTVKLSHLLRTACKYQRMKYRFTQQNLQTRKLYYLHPHEKTWNANWQQHGGAERQHVATAQEGCALPSSGEPHTSDTNKPTLPQGQTWLVWEAGPHYSRKICALQLQFL